MRINPPLLAAGLLLNLTTLTAEATLTPYTSDGKAVVYSSVSDVTWTGDANLLGTLEASNPNLVSTIISAIGSVTDRPTLSTVDFGANGLVSWFGAQAYVSYLNTINYAGSQQWALPSAGVDPQEGYNQTGGQFGQLYYNELNKLAFHPGSIGSDYGILGDGSYDTSGTAGPFGNAQTYAYWFGTEYADIPGLAWYFNTIFGNQFNAGKDAQFYAWAVSPGQVSAVPLPGTVWLLGTGLVGLLSLKRRGYAG